VFGVYAPGEQVSHLAYFGLFALQHRGQESAGIATSDGRTVTVFKDMGLVAQVFDEPSLAGLEGGHLAIGHTRYSTTGSNNWENAQPVHRQGPHLRRPRPQRQPHQHRQLAAELGGGGATTDSDLMLEAIARRIDDERSDGAGSRRRCSRAPHLRGCLLAGGHGPGPAGGGPGPPRVPAALPRALKGGGWVLASETAALDLVGPPSSVTSNPARWW
jgi:amidophosphoribosyltransferase